MPYNIEFPALYKITQMQADRLKAVGDNLEYYSVDVRIDYERWISFETEYGEWSRVSSNNFKQDQEAN
jgi:hypothetical protein